MRTFRAFRLASRRQLFGLFIPILCLGLLSGCDIRAVESRAVYAAVMQAYEKGTHTQYVMEQVADPTDRLKDAETLGLYRSFTFPMYRRMHSALDFGEIDVRLITKAKYDWLFMYDCKEGWETFFRNYKDAKSIIRFSNVGYHANGREAIVYFADRRGCLLGQGGLVLLEKKQDRWKVVKTIDLWIS